MREANMNKENAMAEIIGASALLYPILADFGAGVEAPVLVYVDGASGVQAFLDAVRGFGLPPVHSLGEVPTMFREVFSEDNLGTIVIKYTSTRYSLSNLEETVQYCGSLLAETVHPLVFIVADRFVPGNVLPYFSGNLYFSAPQDCSDQIEATDIMTSMIDSVVKNQKRLRAEINEIVDADDDGVALFFSAEACIEMVMLSNGVSKEEIQAFGKVAVSALEEIREHWMTSCDPEAYVEAFVQRLSDVIRERDVSPILLDHYHVYAKDFEKIAFANFYDDEAYYFTPAFFSEICEPIAAQVGVTFLNRQLALAGLLENGKGKRNYYTSKVEIVTEYGIVERVRRVKLYRRVLEKNEEISFVDLILMKMEDENDTEGNLLGQDGWGE